MGVHDIQRTVCLLILVLSMVVDLTELIFRAATLFSFVIDLARFFRSASYLQRTLQDSGLCCG